MVLLQIFFFWGTSMFWQWLHLYIPTDNAHGFPFPFDHSYFTRWNCIFFVLLWWHFIVILMWNSLMSSDGWHLKIHLLPTCLLLTNVPSGPLLFFRLSYFLVAIELITYSGWSHHSWRVCRRVLLCVRTTRCASFVLCSFGCLFAVVSFAMQRLLNLMQLHLSILDFFFACVFGDTFKNRYRN